MRAHLDDQRVIESPTTSGAKRDGEIVGLHHKAEQLRAMCWSDTDVRPGPDVHIHHLKRGQPGTIP
ncbi:hypothetical protein ACWDG1_43565 [Streptomyces sp. NPDC001177]